MATTEFKILKLFLNTCVFHVRNDLEVDRSAEGNYSTELYGAKAAQIIRWQKFNFGRG